MRITQISQTNNNRTKSTQKQNFGALSKELIAHAQESIKGTKDPVKI